jgi:hypothetical protein
LADYAVILDTSGLTVSGPGTLIVPAGQSQSLSGTTLASALVNRGTIVVRPGGLAVGSTISGALTNAAGAILRVQGLNSSANLTVTTEFTNQGAIELTSAGFTDATLSITNGILVNAAGATISALPGVGGSSGRTFGGQLSNLGTINVFQSMNYNGPSFSNAGVITVGDSQTLTVTGTALNNVAGGTLTGSGTVFGNVSGGGLVTPGNPLGALMVNGNIGLGGLSTYLIGPAAGQYAQLKITGTLNVSGPLSLSIAFTPQIGSTYRIIDNTGTGTVTGVFAGLQEGATLTQAGVSFRISYVGGTGNDVVLTVTAVAPVTVQAVTIDDGTGQRSMVRSVTVAFSRLITLVGQPSAAFQLTRTGPGLGGK